jgi:hypothetical protein
MEFATPITSSLESLWQAIASSCLSSCKVNRNRGQTERPYAGDRLPARKLAVSPAAHLQGWLGPHESIELIQNDYAQPCRRLLLLAAYIRMLPRATWKQSPKHSNQIASWCIHDGGQDMTLPRHADCQLYLTNNQPAVGLSGRSNDCSRS